MKYKFLEKLNAIRFHGKPVKINPLTNSVKPNKIENNRNELIKFFEFKKLNKKVNNP